MENDSGDRIFVHVPAISDVDSAPESQSSASLRLFDVKRLLTAAVTLLPWLVLVALVSLVPEQPLVPGVSAQVASLAGHVLVYAVLAALIYWLHAHMFSGSKRQPLYSALIAAVGATVIGLLFEFSQQLLTDNRTFQSKDVIANAFGASFVSVALVLLELSGSKLKLLMPAIFASGAALTVLAATSYVLWDPSLPYKGDHWHVAYRVVICGETQPLFTTGPGSIHTHGRGVIHIHPQGNGDEGREANLANFVRSAGGTLTNSSITLPTGQTYTNGDTCSDGSVGTVTVSQFDVETMTRIKTVSSPADYVPRDLEMIIIEFGEISEGI